MTADTALALHPLLATRTSPRSMDPGHALADDHLALLLEAARWAPSSSNTQPWRFLVGLRGDETFRTITGTLASGNLTWAPNASALLLAVAERQDRDGGVRSHAAWDTGQAVAHLTVQAAALGLVVRQMGGFSPDAARGAFAIPARFDPLTVVAVGRELPTDGDAQAPARVRRPIEGTAFSAWGTPLDLGSSGVA